MLGPKDRDGGDVRALEAHRVQRGEGALMHRARGLLDGVGAWLGALDDLELARSPERRAARVAAIAPPHRCVEGSGPENEACERLDRQGVRRHEAHAWTEDARLDRAKRAALRARRIDIDQEDRRPHVERRFGLREGRRANRSGEVEVDDGSDREAVDVALRGRDVLAEDRAAFTGIAFEIGASVAATEVARPGRVEEAERSAGPRERERRLARASERRFVLVDDGTDALRGHRDGRALALRGGSTRDEREDEGCREKRAKHRPATS